VSSRASRPALHLSGVVGRVSRRGGCDVLNNGDTSGSVLRWVANLDSGSFTSPRRETRPTAVGNGPQSDTDDRTVDA